MLVHLCLSVLLTVISLIDLVCTVTYELINDDDDDDDEMMVAAVAGLPSDHFPPGPSEQVDVLR